MREIYAQAAERLRQGHPFALATLVAVRNAAPSPIGTSLLVDTGGSFRGNIGAGCHEGEVVETAHAMIADGTARLVSFGLDDELTDGSACGASLDVVVWRPDISFLKTAEAIAAGDEACEFAVPMVGEDGTPFTVRVAARRTLAIVGATTLGADLAAIGRRCDFRTIVIDPRPAFATRERIPHSDVLTVAWPDDALPGVLNANTALLVMSHDAKIDLPALRAGLASDVPYIGLLGSRRSQRVRLDTLQSQGYRDEQLARIYGPAGLDLGGTTPAQTALSILSEVTAMLNGRSGLPLRTVRGSIHNTVLLAGRS